MNNRLLALKSLDRLRVPCPPGPPEYFLETRKGGFLAGTLKSSRYKYLQRKFDLTLADQED
jgi:hypothetical protein